MSLSVNILSVISLFILTLLVTGCASKVQAPEPLDETPTAKDVATQTPSPILILQNEYIAFSISRENGSILQVEDKLSGLKLIKDPVGDLPPWRLYFFDPTTNDVEERETWERFTLEIAETSEGGDRVNLHWQLAESVAIEAIVELPPESPTADFQVKVLNGSARTIQQLEFPILRGIGRLVDTPAEDNLLLHPVAGGLLFVDPLGIFQRPSSATPGLRHIPYPEGVGAFAQFMAYYAKDRGGFYFACHDPLNTTKEVDFYSPTQIKGLEALFAHKSWDVTPGNDLILDYPIVLGALEEGSWYAAAERYRDWATATGEGHPDWCGKGRLEDRVREGTAAKWLVEEVGFSTFGMPSSFDVSPWLEAFHHIADKPVFHVLGHDWPQWGGSSVERMERLDSMFAEAGLKPFHMYSLNELWFPHITVPLELLDDQQGHRQFFEMLGVHWSTLPEGRWREIFETYNCCGPWLPPETSPLPWFPTRFHPANLDAIESNGDFFAPFFFDFFSYGHDHETYGMNIGSATGWQLPSELVQAGFAKIWMDPTTSFWQDFHADRDRRIVVESGADGLYYDISAGAGPRWSDRDDHGHPPGYGRWLWDGYAETFQLSKEAASAEKGAYVAQGVEMGLETLIPYIDFNQWRAGGLVQGDIELMPFMDLVKQGRVEKLPLFSHLYHEYGPVMLDGWAKLSQEFGDIFYLIASQIALQQGGLVELNYEYSPLERFPGMEGPTYQLMYHTAIYREEQPYDVDPQKVAFLREVALARTEFATEYLAYGKAMRPVVFLTPIPEIELTWDHYNSIGGRRERGVFTAPSVVQQVWSYKDEKLGVLMVNLDVENSIEVEITLDPMEYSLQERSYQIWRITRENRERLGTWEQGEDLRLTVRLPPRVIVLVEFRP
jgi:hypothetical protein